MDAAGFLTVGYGHKLASGESFRSVTEAEAENILCEDMKIAVDAVNRLVKVELNQGQFDCLCDFTFNMGQGKLADSTLLKKLNSGDYACVPYELYHLDPDGTPHGWILAGGKVLEGLVNRRKAEIALWNGEPC
jgi:lysozyme